MEKTLVLIKPDAVKRGLIGKILSIYEENGLSICRLYKKHLNKELLAKHYEEHIHRDFYPSLVEFMLEDEVVVVEIQGDKAVSLVREINGATNPSKARPCTIRYIYGESVQRNVVHGSADLEDAKRELSIWF
ncbi:nucleoside-diphosphate kinase [Acidaminobacter sp. JC074]|uniref:nucleoside-diphosphate kinase n=1 Tax=Acidaminobacter sp. JC074 TaxID=2530199 RepID=UPI001F0DCE39|nr:nucleoside-diphosphate kinase [Acidaminobacter sp. JC074]